MLRTRDICDVTRNLKNFAFTEGTVQIAESAGYY
jgi:hypothetical protein